MQDCRLQLKKEYCQLIVWRRLQTLIKQPWIYPPKKLIKLLSFFYIFFVQRHLIRPHLRSPKCKTPPPGCPRSSSCALSRHRRLGMGRESFLLLLLVFLPMQVVICCFAVVSFITAVRCCCCCVNSFGCCRCCYCAAAESAVAASSVAVAAAAVGVLLVMLWLLSSRYCCLLS